MGNRAKRVTKADVILIGLLLLAGVVSLLVVRVFVQKGGTTVQILSDGELYGTYELKQDQRVPIRKNGKVINTLEIAQQKAKMIQADCPDQLCVHQKAISRQGETIVCLPHKIVVQIAGGQDAGLDSMSQ